MSQPFNGKVDKVSKNRSGFTLEGESDTWYNTKNKGEAFPDFVVRGNAVHGEHDGGNWNNVQWIKPGVGPQQRQAAMPQGNSKQFTQGGDAPSQKVSEAVLLP